MSRVDAAGRDARADADRQTAAAIADQALIRRWSSSRRAHCGGGSPTPAATPCKGGRPMGRRVPTGRETPPPASYGPDHLDLAARHVRAGAEDSPIHLLVGEPYTLPETGRHYRIPCNRRPLTAERDGAMLTTRDVTCVGCGGGRRG